MLKKLVFLLLVMVLLPSSSYAVMNNSAQWIW